ncbi:hypothetical protein [Methylobacterium aquaticum]|uniref:hypothetical protein n=1 Tax=Methylobacterium aquaticum TaxID=270351 RepID=UPI001933BC11|nr:hypothetical protein [Methylobacterium aquaticum]QRE77001.1 hypothetical protein F1D61_28710 [Methylobacterium aquaticum]
MNAVPQLAFDFIAPPVSVRTPTPIADRIIAAGLEANDFLLNLNRGLTNPDEVPAPSRMYRFPIVYQEPDEEYGEPEALYLRHPGLARMPFVLRVQELLGVAIKPRELDKFGRPYCELAQWWHATDLMSDAHWQRLWESRHLTTEDHIVHAIQFGMELPASWEGKSKRQPRLSVTTARRLLLEMGHGEPADRSEAAILGEGLSPGHIGKTWALNVRAPGPAGAWLIVHGIEDNWFTREGGGHLVLSPKCLTARGLS